MNPVSGCGPHTLRPILRCQNLSIEEQWGGEELGVQLSLGATEGAGPSSAKQRLNVEHVSLYNYLKEGRREKMVGLFFQVNSNRTRGSSLKLCQRDLGN